jgi:hypothetical protein
MRLDAFGTIGSIHCAARRRDGNKSGSGGERGFKARPAPAAAQEEAMTLWSKMGAGLAALPLLAAPPTIGLAADASHPTVVELFQSQGCSDCPPAAANVAALSDRSDVLALGFSVDYWDRLGWKDVFAKPEYTARQYAYARALRLDGVYTPQVVVNGRVEGVGVPADELTRLVKRGDRGSGGPKVDFAAGAVSVGAGLAPSDGADVWLARYDPRTIEVDVRRGENAGRRLAHKNVVREMILLGHWRGEAAIFALPPVREPGLADAAIVQATGAGPILAAAKR